MANTFKFVLNRSGVRDLLKSKEALQVCEEYASNALAKLGEGYTSDSMIKNRANATVYADTYQAKAENKEHNTILKALR